MSDFPGTKHYREKTKTLRWIRADDVDELCDHIEDQDKEIERLRGTVERYIRKACDEHAKWSGYYYEEKTKNADLRFRISQLENELSKASLRTESSEE